VLNVPNPRANVRFFSTLVMQVRGHLQVRNKKIRRRIGNNNDAHSKMRTATERVIRRRLSLLSRGVLLQSRTIDSSLMKRGSVLRLFSGTAAGSHRLYPA
jgi:hypothetical protein